MKLQGEVAIVTGGGRNIGQSICELLAREGARVVVADIDGAAASKVADDLSRNGSEAISVVTDVSKEEELRRLIDVTLEKWGHIDIVVNNVAMTDQKNIFDIDKATWDRVIALTLTSTFLLSKFAAEAMRRLGTKGRIVNIGSTSGFRGRERAIAYTAAKGGIANLTRSLAVQLGRYGIRVNSVAPNKAGSPLGRDTFDSTRPVINLKDNKPPTPLDVANAVLFLVSNDSDYVVGQTIFVDGGLMVMELT